MAITGTGKRRVMGFGSGFNTFMFGSGRIIDFDKPYKRKPGVFDWDYKEKKKRAKTKRTKKTKT